ncbi:dorsal-ventral patterning protein Sog-like [Dendroctonus ponderosae]|uniref:VWFC domain-containing protein n=1 Tax=Dendroctonus ponderosae TaxID=77166 RepID=A0AAR5QJ39_DENPD|nr:dorsal-ventral patterning protein Sog isoform X2 [Dendroctonus ponderosae]XP_048523962.1 dorsal-ventral patterning protein Sog-like [Dendroctonus ponderosae]XP_048523977.1 dorsal-ventral patterning protein Sog-like [Dendroctonus ponderosae]
MAVFRYCVCFILAANFAGIVLGRNKAPLIDDDNIKTRVKAAECVFDKQVRELGAVWVPDLGPPIGVLPCMRCKCVPYHKKRRIVARVQCSSIKDQCPVPSCDEPIVLPGRCCKTCPGDISPDASQDVVPQPIVELDEKSGKHFAALLTGRSALAIKNEFSKPISPMNKNNVVATGRFSVHRRNLYYSFYISENAARPQSLQFLDQQGNILEEFTLSHTGGFVNSLYQNASRKVCGVWRRLAKDYRKLLKQEKMFAVLVWGVKDQAEFTLSGQILKNGALPTELLSALLEPAPGSDSLSMTGAGGTAIVSISTSVTPSINVAIIFNGLFMPAEVANIPINITLSMDERKQIVLQETVQVSKPATDINVVNVSSSITQAHLRYLTRGRIIISVTSVSKPDALKLSGNVITKASCEMFQTTLSSAANTPNPDGVSGMAWLYLNNVGSLIYNIQIDKLPPKENPPIITLIDTSSKKKTELEDLTPYFHGDGWANGTLDKLTPRVLEPLYSGDLAINVATTSDNSLIKGKLISKPVDEARDAAAPVLLKREYTNLSTGTVGLAWISVDNDCHLHYDISMTGIGQGRKMELWLELYPMIAPGAPYINKQLDAFEGNSVEGSPVEVLTDDELNRLENGVSFLKVKDERSKMALLIATVTKVSIPPPCRPYSSPDFSLISQHDIIPIISTGECFFEEKFYKNEEIWVSAKNPCQMCYCQDGSAKCDFMTCPASNCTEGKQITITGECCPLCVNNSIPVREYNGQKCTLSGKSYLPGTRFHPFLIPFGFDKCTECYCDPDSYQIRCSRLNDNEKHCCPNCNKKTFDINDPLSDDFVSREVSDYSVKDHGSEYQKKKENIAAKILEEGGCKNPSNPKKPFANGAEYHPYIDSLGEYKCVTCKCQNGTPKCSRQHCDLPTCKKIQDIKRKKEKVNLSDFCCSSKDCRKLRHKKKHALTS